VIFLACILPLLKAALKAVKARKRMKYSEPVKRHRNGNLESKIRLGVTLPAYICYVLFNNQINDGRIKPPCVMEV